MGDDVVISVENLGKKYRIRRQAEGRRYVALRDVLANKAKNLFARNGDAAQPANEDFWALKDVSFQVKKGDVVGIIGRNGAGKSTLLKILSRITEPTEGRVRLRGRVASLLEVGTGFHPELTGRENIFLNGAILGMTRTEIKSKFDEIVAFAEVDKFLDTPVKRYSSGMHVRLAFAVAAHLEPEILIVDEVLAVGDAQFQNKCLGRMRRISTEKGRTVLFVSHNMSSVKALCAWGMLLHKGRIQSCDNVSSVVGSYLKEASGAADVMKEAFNPATGVGIRDVSTELREGENGLELRLGLTAFSAQPQNNVGVGFSLQTSECVTVASVAPMMTHYVINYLQGSVRCEFACGNINKQLAGGTYRVHLWLSHPRIAVLVEMLDAAEFNIAAPDPYGTGVGFDAAAFGVIPLHAKFTSNASRPREGSLVTEVRP